MSGTTNPGVNDEAADVVRRATRAVRRRRPSRSEAEECESCGRMVGSYVPAGGDGSARRVVQHGPRDDRCPGKFAKDWGLR